MSDELKEILSRFGDEWLSSPKPYLTLIKKTAGKIRKWHIRERKKWALDLLAKAYKSWLNSEKGGTFEGEIRKKIEEG